MRKYLVYFVSVLYVVVAILVIYSRIAKLPQIENIFRPLLLTLLILWYVIGSYTRNSKINWGFMLGLFFSLVGDIFRTPFLNHFIWGLAFYLIAHVLYSFIFLWDCKGSIIKSLSQGWLFVLIIFLILLSLLIGLLPGIMKQNNDIHLIAAPILVIVLLLLVLSTYVYSRVNFNNFGPLVLIGGLFFIFSDSFLAFNKFSLDIKLSSAWIIGSYVLAHWFLVFGYMNSKTSN